MTSRCGDRVHPERCGRLRRDHGPRPPVQVVQYVSSDVRVDETIGSARLAGSEGTLGEDAAPRHAEVQNR